MDNNELIKAISETEKINKNKQLKEEYPKEKEESNIEGFDSLLKDEMDKLKNNKDELKQTKDYLSLLKEIYEKENRRKNL